ncbi:MAG: hypothetical protein Q7N50_12300 [Armatimonadota bacterium]|nr:hypothetical protein [Armatimonadota bacterium]
MKDNASTISSALRIAVLRDDFPYASAAFVDELSDTLQAENPVTVVSGIDLANLLSSKPKKVDALVLPDARFFPADAKEPLLGYLRQGGHLLVVGGPALGRMMVLRDGKWLDKTGLREAQNFVEPAKLLADNSSVWRQAAGEKNSRTRMSVTESGDPDLGKAIKVDMPILESWDQVALEGMEDPFVGGYLTVFWAKGDGTTPEISVEWGESDGSQWYAKVSVTPNWRKYVIPSDEFKYLPESPAGASRGGRDDKFKPENAVHLAFGQRMGLTTNPQGSHSFSIARIGVAGDDFKNVDFAPPILETISPAEYSPGLAYKSFTLRGAARLEPYKNQTVFGNNMKKDSPGELICPTWRPRGLGTKQTVGCRWIPLISAYDAKGEFRGTPVSMMVNTSNQFAGSIWGLAGFADPDFLTNNGDYVTTIVRDLLYRMTSGAFINYAGVEHFCYVTDETVKVGASLGCYGRDRVTEVDMKIRKGDHIVWSKFCPVADCIDVSEDLSNIKLTPGCHTFEATAMVKGRILDRICYEFSVIDAERKISDDVVTVKDGDFYLRGEKWYPIGINFWPLYCSGHETSEFRGTSWQSPSHYDPEWIDLDLDQLVSLNMNSVSIQSHGIGCVRPVMDFLERCGNRDLKANISVPAHPILNGPKDAIPFIEEARFASSDVVYSYDLAWEPHVGPEEERKPLDPQWRRWIEDRYGSVENAEKDWNYKITQADGSVTGPTNDQLMNNGPWITMVAAYRRFADDLISKGYGERIREIKKIDPNHLMGVRTGYGGTGQYWISHRFPFDLISGVKHLDYTSPEGYGLGGEYINYRRAGFINLYGRFVGGGRPVFWAEYGVPHYFQGNDWSWSEEGQTHYFRDMHRMFFETDVNGGAGWWWPGGHRVDEDSDFGIINQDRTPRDSAIEVQKIAKLYQTCWPERIPAGHWIEIDRDLHVSGLPMIWQNNWDEYIAAMDEGKTVGLKTKGTGTDSSNTPMTAVGNTPLTGLNPPKYLNAEFNWFEMLNASGNWVEVTDGATIDVAAGQPIKFKTSVGNTAESAWLTPDEAGEENGGVYLISNNNDKWALPDRVPYLADAEFPELEMSGITQEIEIAFRMLAENRSAFGEILRFNLRPVAVGKEIK